MKIVFHVWVLLYVWLCGLCWKETSSLGIRYSGLNSSSLSSLEDRKRGLDVFSTGPALIKRYGYPVETHTVTTEDGYLLTVFRIPGSPRAASSGVKTPVFLQHGVVSSSDDWVATGPERGLGFQLADQGYDVWMGNSRGNLFSRKHVTLSPNDKKFWDFTWQEMGLYDLAATTDYILATTRQKQIYFLGYSLGSNMFFVLASLRPEYNHKIRLMVALAPAVYDGQRGSFNDAALRISLLTGKSEALPRSVPFNYLLLLACQDGSPFQGVCAFLYYNFFGRNKKELNRSLLPLYWSRIVSGTSMGTVEHLVQIFETERFQMFDRGARKRGFVTNTPEYNLALVTAPVAIIYGDNDAIVRPKGIFRLRSELPNVVRTIRVADAETGHRDFVFANRVTTLVNDQVIHLLNQH